VGEQARRDPAGYLDVLPDSAAPASTGTVQDLMLTETVPRIYERWWRPALSRLVKGVLGPGMRDEHRIARLLLVCRPATVSSTSRAAPATSRATSRDR
jgi:hypothetical protein